MIWKCPLCVEPAVVTDEERCPECRIQKQDALHHYNEMNNR